MNEIFHRLAVRVSTRMGSPYAFFFAIGLVIVWLITGPAFGYSNTWQLFINTCTTIITFIMVFLIQNTQSRDAKAVHLKLDELLKTDHGARSWIVGLEDLTDEELDDLYADFQKMHDLAYSHITAHLHEHVQRERLRRKR